MRTYATLQPLPLGLLYCTMWFHNVMGLALTESSVDSITHSVCPWRSLRDQIGCSVPSSYSLCVPETRVTLAVLEGLYLLPFIMYQPTVIRCFEYLKLHIYNILYILNTLKLQL